MMFTSLPSIAWGTDATLLRVMLKLKYKNAWGQYQDTSCVYIHIPKNAGTSVSLKLYGHTINHVPAKVLNVLDKERYEASTTFSILRQPTDRFISGISHCLNGSRASSQDLALGYRLRKYGSDPLSIACALVSLPRYRMFMLISPSVIFAPQSHFVCDKHLNVLVDHCFALERSPLVQSDCNTGDYQRSQVIPECLEKEINGIYAHDFMMYDSIPPEHKFVDARSAVSAIIT